MKYSRLFALLLPLAATLDAQSPPTHVVSGIVYDSIGHAPLAGAVVQARLVDSTQSDAGPATTPRNFVAVADAAGHFRLTGLPAGRFAIGFQHDALNALGLESPIDAFELGADSSITMNLAIPSGAAVRARLCSNKADGSHDGLLAGFVLGAHQGVALYGAEVIVQWTELGLDHGKLRSAPVRVAATVGDDGTYRACGVPNDGPISIKVVKAAYRSIEGDLTMPEGGVARRDFHLADSGVVHGTATLVGRVMQEDGSALSSGLAAIPALALEVAVSRGDFSIAELPAGTWIVEVRAIGYEPLVTLADVAERATSNVKFTLVKKAQTLEAVNVVGKAGRDLRVLNDIQQRSLIASGTVFLQGNSWLASALVTSDVIRAARGFSFKSPTKVEGRPYVLNGKLVDCKSNPSNDSVMSVGGKQVTIYVDGLRYPGGLETLNNAVLANQVLAIEAYPDVTSAPFLWRTNDACAVIAVWTKH